MPKRPPAKKPGMPTEKASGTSWLAIGLVLAVMTLVVYLPVRNFDFINYDDPEYVAQNVMIQRAPIGEAIKWAFTSAYSFNWHPVTWMSHLLDCRMFGVKPGAHHLVNVVLHIANTILLFGLFRRMTRATWESAFVAGIFAVHPLHVESVAWICERKDVLSTFFWLLTTWAYVQFVQGRGDKARARRWYIVALACFALGLMSKPMLVTLPFTLLLLDFWPLRRMSFGPADGGRGLQLPFRSLLLEKIPFFFLTVASSLTTFLVQRSEGAVADTQVFPVGLRVANAFISYVRYLGKTFWPDDLMIFYPYPETWPVWQSALAAAVIVFISVAVLWKAKAVPFLAVGWFWFIGTLVPVIGLVQVGIQSMADRYMYVPLIGLSIMMAWGLGPVLHSRLMLARGILGVMIIACLVLTSRQLRHWRDSVSVFEHAISIEPNHVMAHVMAGNAYTDRADVEKAMHHYGEALKRSPNFAEVHYNLGNLLMHQSRAGDAVKHYEKAVELRADYIDARANLAVALSSLGRNAEALAHEEAALKQRPDDPTLLRNISVDLMELKRFDEAGTYLQRALQMKPEDAVLYKLLGDVLLAKNSPNEAALQYRKALQLQPDFEDARRSLERIQRVGSP